MRPDRRIDAAAGALGVLHDVMQRFAHSVQALEFERRAILRHMQDRGHSMCVVRRELRVDPVGHAQQLARIGDVADVGMMFRCEYRKLR